MFETTKRLVECSVDDQPIPYAGQSTHWCCFGEDVNTSHFVVTVAMKSKHDARPAGGLPSARKDNQDSIFILQSQTGHIGQRQGYWCRTESALRKMANVCHGCVSI